jgi:ketosteroid isomerase-like protein
MKDAHGQPVNDHGKLVEIWKKQADGKWKVAVDIFNSDLPVAAPATK